MRILPPISKKEFYDLVKTPDYKMCIPPMEYENLMESIKRTINNIIKESNKLLENVLNSLDKEQLYECYAKYSRDKNEFGLHYNKLVEQYRKVNENREIQ